MYDFYKISSSPKSEGSYIYIVNLGSIKAQRKVLQLISSHEMEIRRNVVKHRRQITMSQAKPAVRTEVYPGGSPDVTKC